MGKWLWTADKCVGYSGQVGGSFGPLLAWRDFSIWKAHVLLWLFLSNVWVLPYYSAISQNQEELCNWAHLNDPRQPGKPLSPWYGISSRHLAEDWPHLQKKNVKPPGYFRPLFCKLKDACWDLLVNYKGAPQQLPAFQCPHFLFPPCRPKGSILFTPWLSQPHPTLQAFSARPYPRFAAFFLWNPGKQ